jgi:hypothetical protein
MMRNSSIMLPPPDFFPVDLCLAWPSDKPGGGGTGQGMRIASGDGVHTKLVNLSKNCHPDFLFQLCEEIKEAE